jgi:hypothetical protein
VFATIRFKATMPASFGEGVAHASTIRNEQSEKDSLRRGLWTRRHSPSRKARREVGGRRCAPNLQASAGRCHSRNLTASIHDVAVDCAVEVRKIDQASASISRAATTPAPAFRVG